jgi:hypothetical protein
MNIIERVGDEQLLLDEGEGKRESRGAGGAVILIPSAGHFG